MDILKYFPEKIEKIIIENVKDSFKLIEEIRLRIGRPIILKMQDGEKIIKYDVLAEDVIYSLQHICENSIYSYQNQISCGFVTINGGHRVGVSGSCVIENGKVININYVYSLNFRIAKEIIGSSKKVIKEILNLEENNIYNTLIASCPGAGKTTILRDLIRQISTGIKDLKFKAINVGVVDERDEISALYKGKPQNDIGVKVDIIENAPKDIAINMLVRSMAPKVIVADEIGSSNDIKAINYAVCSGVKGIFTAHRKLYG